MNNKKIIKKIINLNLEKKFYEYGIGKMINQKVYKLPSKPRPNETSIKVGGSSFDPVCPDLTRLYSIVRMRKIITVLEFGSGKSTSARHVCLLCDIMCNKGKIMAANRHGINNSNIGPLAKCSFEETTDQFKSAGIFGMKDLIEGVSANIMVGQIPKCGTGDSEIILDEEKIVKFMKEKSAIEKQKSEKEEKDEINDIFNQEEFVNNDLFDIDLIEGDNIDI